MKLIYKACALILSLIMLLGVFPPAYAAEAPQSYVTSDCEGYYEGLFYFASNDNSPYAYRETAINENRQILTDYRVDAVAVTDGGAYLLAGRSLILLDVDTLTQQTLYTSRADIERFAVGGGRILMLISGSVVSLNPADKTVEPVIASGAIERFWTEDDGTICYMTGSRYIFRYDPASGTQTRENNFISTLTDGGSGAQSNAMELGALMRKFPSGKYWNHVGSSSNNPNGYTSNPCTHHSGNCDYYGGCGCNSFNSAIQCMGYAGKCAYDVYGSYSSNWTKYTSSSSAMNNVKAGDVIRCRNDGHSIFVTGVNGDTITYTDCNGDGHCVIKWNRTASKSTIRSSFTYLRSAPYEAPGNTSADSEYTITFDANGGTVKTTSAKVKAGDKYGTLPEPDREGYDFSGWYTSASGGSKVDSNDKPNSSITLYAQWTIKTYYITFEKNGGNYAPDNFSKVYGESKSIANRTPVRDGYTFVSWNTADDGSGTAYKPGSTYSANESATLYAIWKGKQIQIRFDANGGYFSGSSYKTVVMGEPYGELPVPTRDGYSFTGWHAGSVNGNVISAETVVNVPSTQVMYASWEIKTYTVSYSANGGSGAPSSQTKTHGSTLVLSSTVPQRPHYSFTGWYTSSDGSGTRYMPGSGYTQNADITLYAGWLGEKYTVKFDANGGEGAPSSVTKTHGTNLTLPEEVPEKTGCSFVEWNTEKDGSGSGFEAHGRYSKEGNTTLYAIWEIAKYTVTYDPAGGENAPAKQVFEYDTSVTIKDGVPARTGHIFLGWFTEENGGGTQYKAGQVYAENADLGLYAFWETEKYTVSYDAQGGTGAPENQIKEFGVDLPLSSAVPQKPGYDFDGWQGDGRVYAPGSTYTDEKGAVLTAIWTPATFSVVFDSNGSSASDTGAQYTYGTSYGKLPVIARKGYEFRGWYTSRTGGLRINDNDRVGITSDSVFYARWTARQYTVTFDANGGTSPVQSKRVNFGSAYGELPVPVKEGYTFTGWSDPQGRVVTANTAFLTDGDVTLTAGWGQGVYTLTFDPAGGACGTVSLQLNAGGTAGELPVPVKEGYTFTGWADENGKAFTAQTAMPGHNVTLTAQYQARSFNISLSPGNGSVSVRSISVTYGKRVGTLPEAKLDGSLFAGWFTADGVEITADTVYNRSESTAVSARYVPVSAGSITYIADGRVSAVLAPSAPQPAVPAKAGFSGSWSGAQNGASYAVYTPREYTVTVHCGGGTVTKSIPCGSEIDIVSSLTAPAGYVIGGFEPALPAFMPAENIETDAVLTPAVYTANFISGGSVKRVEYTVEGCEAPAVPAKEGYTGKWQSFTPVPGGMTVFAEYTPVVYNAVFRALGRTVKTEEYTVETESVKLPAIPLNNGYTGRWEDFDFLPGGVTVNAVYTPNTYKVTFRADGAVIGTVSYVYGAKSVTEPEIPQKTGYTAAWEKYTLGYSDFTVNAVYTPVTYYATFVANGRVVAKVPFTVEQAPAAPSVPSKQGYTCKWSDYTLGACDITVKAVYIPNSEVYILGYTQVKKIDYLTTITFRVKVFNEPDDYEVHWIIDGVDTGTGNGDGTCTVFRAKKDFTVSAKVVCEGESSKPSAEEKVDVDTGFFARIIGWIRRITGRLHTITQ